MRTFSDLFLGSAIRELPVAHKSLYLTFDDGPDGETTPRILDLLAKHSAHATFFLISEKAVAAPELCRKILQAGHALGNHSPDHAYRHYFTHAPKLKTWITRAEQQLQQISGTPSVGFRPPAGIRTPRLKRAVAELNEPMILWSVRFFDSIRPWKKSQAKRSLARLKAGDIILLHDRQAPQRMENFLETLDFFLHEARALGFEFHALERRACLEAMSSLR